MSESDDSDDEFGGGSIATAKVLALITLISLIALIALITIMILITLITLRSLLGPPGRLLSGLIARPLLPAITRSLSLSHTHTLSNLTLSHSHIRTLSLSFAQLCQNNQAKNHNNPYADIYISRSIKSRLLC